MQSLLQRPQQKLSVGQEQELRELCAEIDYRRRINPLQFYEHLPQQLSFHNDTSKEKNLFGGNRCKPLDSVVLMGDGHWKILQDIKRGDFVICAGEPVQVNAIHRAGKKECYRIEFEDGGFTVASEEHYYPISFGSRRKFIKRPLKDLLKRKKTAISKKARFLSYKNIEFKSNHNLPIHPYLLGILLGDGGIQKKGIRFTNQDKTILDKMRLILSLSNMKLSPLKNSKIDFCLVSNKKYSKNIILDKLKKLNLICNSGNKFIPHIYKISSPDNRKQLLAGLIDTDGSKDEFCSKSRKLANDICFLIRSLGGKATLSETYKICTNSFKKEKKLYYRVYWRLNEPLPLLLSYKQSFTKRMPEYSHRVVSNIQYIGLKECGDITVNHPDHCFVSDDWVVTSNSGKTEEVSEYIVTKCLAKPKQRWWACAESFPDSVNIQQRKVWGIAPKNRIAYGHYDDINGFPNRKLKLDNGSMIIFKSYDQGTMSFAQDDCDGIWNDEEPPYDIYKEQRMRLIDRDGEMIISMTSVKGVTDLIADIFEDCDIIESRHSDILNEDLPVVAEKNGIKFYMLWNTDNPYINQERLQHEIKFLLRDEIKCRVHGIPINLSGKIYPMFNKRIHVIPFEQAPTKDVQIWHILDPHDSKPWAMAWIIVDKTDTFYCIDEYPNRDFHEITSDNKTYAEYSDIIKQKEDALYDIYGVDVIKRIIDPNFGKKTIRLTERADEKAHTSPVEELRKYGFKKGKRGEFQDGVDLVEAGHIKVRELLHYEIKDGEIVVQPKFFITDNNINSSKGMSRYSRKDLVTADGDVKEESKPQEKWKHYPDLFRYFAMARPRYFAAPQDFVVETERAY